MFERVKYHLFDMFIQSDEFLLGPCFDPYAHSSL